MIVKERYKGWSSLPTTELDDYAYFLYVSENEYYLANQLGIIANKKYYLDYYERANILLRKVKIERLLKNGNK